MKNASEILALAAKHAATCAGESAKTCLIAGRDQEEAGNLYAAAMWGCRSLAYSVGVGHKDYIRASAGRDQYGVPIKLVDEDSPRIAVTREEYDALNAAFPLFMEKVWPSLRTTWAGGGVFVSGCAGSGLATRLLQVRAELETVR